MILGMRNSRVRPVFPVLLSLVFLSAGALAGEARFTFAVLGDRTGSQVPGVFERVVGEVAFLDPDFIITVGDHIEGYTFDRDEVEWQWDEFEKIMDAAGIKYYVTPGNHDIWDEQSEEIYRDRFGDLNRSFKVENVRFLILDVSRHYGFGDFSEEQIKWLTKELEKSKDADHIFVFLHKPFWCEDFSFGRESPLHETFVEHGVTAVFSGHYHRYLYTERDGVEYYGVGSSGGGMWSSEREGAFYCYMLGQVVGDSLRIELVEPGFFRPVDSVTMESVIDLTRFKKESIELSEIRVEGNSLTGTAKVSVAIVNTSERTLRDTARWELQEGWTVEPQRDYIEVPPEEVGQLTAYVSTDGLLFPVPSLRIRLPYRDQEPFDIEAYLNIRRVERATRLVGVPIIDGVLDDDVWGAVDPETEYFGWRGGESTGDPTSLWLGFDSLNLYVAVECIDAEPDSIRATVDERDGFAGHDDHIGLLLQPDRQAEVFYQIIVNPNGAIYDREIEISPYGSYVMHPGWNSSAKGAARIFQSGWTAELMIPLADLRWRGADSEWGFNFQRHHVHQQTVSNFQAPLTFSSYNMGILQFK